MNFNYFKHVLVVLLSLGINTTIQAHDPLATSTPDIQAHSASTPFELPQLDLLDPEPSSEPSDASSDAHPLQNINDVIAQAASTQHVEMISQEISRQLDVLAEITSDVAQILNNNQVRLTQMEKSIARTELASLGTMIGKMRYSAFLLAQKENFPALLNLLAPFMITSQMPSKLV